MDFCKAYNASTESQRGTVIPAEITIYEDRSFTFITKTPPTPVLLRQAAGHREGLVDAAPRDGRRRSRKAQVREIAETKMPDVNAIDIEGAMAPGRRHRPLDGHRSRRLEAVATSLAAARPRPRDRAQHRGSSEEERSNGARQEVRRRIEEVRQDRAARTRPGVRAREVARHPQLRRDGRGRVQARCRPPQGRPDAAQHGLAARGHRQGRAGRGVRHRRRRRGGRDAGRRRGRRRRPRRPGRRRASSTSTSRSRPPT